MQSLVSSLPTDEGRRQRGSSLSAAGNQFPPASCSLIGAASGGYVAVKLVGVGAPIWMRRVGARHIAKCALVGVFAVLKCCVTGVLHAQQLGRENVEHVPEVVGELPHV